MSEDLSKQDKQLIENLKKKERNNEIEKKILNLLRYSCYHYDYYNYKIGRRNDITCTQIYNEVYKLSEISDDLGTKIYDYITKKNNNECCRKNNSIKPMLKYIFTKMKYLPISYVLDIDRRPDGFNSLFDDALKNGKIYVSKNELMSKIIHYYAQGTSGLCKKLIDHFKYYDDDVLIAMINKNWIGDTINDKIFIKNFPISKKVLLTIIINKNTSRYSKITPGLFDYVLKLNNKNKLTNEYLNCAVNAKDYQMIYYFLDHKLIPTHETIQICCRMSSVSSLIDTLRTYGHYITYEDARYIIINVRDENIDDVLLKEIKEFIDLNDIHDAIKYKKIRYVNVLFSENIQPTIETIELLLEHNYLTSVIIKCYELNYSIKPTYSMVKNASERKDSQLINYFLKVNPYIFDVECIISMINNLDLNKDDMGIVKQKYRDLENKQKEYTQSLKIISKYKKKYGEINAEDSDDSDDDDDSDDSESETIVQQKVENNDKKSLNNETEVSKTKLIKETWTNNKHTTDHSEITIDNNLTKLVFGKSIKNMNYLGFRSMYIDLIFKNKLYLQGNENILKIPQSVIDLNINKQFKKIKYIKIQDIDDFVIFVNEYVTVNPSLFTAGTKKKKMSKSNKISDDLSDENPKSRSRVKKEKDTSKSNKIS